MTGANQLDKHGNQNLSAFGAPDRSRPAQMFGLRGAPGNSINQRHQLLGGASTPTRVFNRGRSTSWCGVGYDKVDPENPAFRFP